MSENLLPVGYLSENANEDFLNEVCAPLLHPNHVSLCPADVSFVHMAVGKKEASPSEEAYWSGVKYM
jgi:hypothetical protein